MPPSPTPSYAPLHFSACPSQSTASGAARPEASPPGSRSGIACRPRSTGSVRLLQAPRSQCSLTSSPPSLEAVHRSHSLPASCYYSLLWPSSRRSSSGSAVKRDWEDQPSSPTPSGETESSQPSASQSSSPGEVSTRSRLS